MIFFLSGESDPITDYISVGPKEYLWLDPMHFVLTPSISFLQKTLSPLTDGALFGCALKERAWKIKRKANILSGQ